MFPLLQPSGLIASEQLSLMTNIGLLMLIVAVPVFILLFFFAWWYRAGNTRALYLPNWEHGAMSELVWWAIPIEIVLVLGALTYTSTHALDPHKPLDSAGTPLTIQVVALPSAWLFIYPDEHIAALGALTIPVDRPVTFHITADAPMNSFWIPALGGQIYAMTGMSTELNLVANRTGTFRGLSANYSGEDFAKMMFRVDAISHTDFDAWLEHTAKNNRTLSRSEYDILRTPNEAAEPVYYGSVTPHLFEDIVMQFMPSGAVPHAH